MIELFDNYVIDADDRQFTLGEMKEQKIKDSEETKQVFSPIGYYGSLKNAMQGAVTIMQRRKVQESTYTLMEAVGMFNMIEKNFEALLSNIKENMPV